MCEFDRFEWFEKELAAIDKGMEEPYRSIRLKSFMTELEEYYNIIPMSSNMHVADEVIMLYEVAGFIGGFD